MTQWKRIEWSSTVEPTQDVRIYHLRGVLTDSREAFEFLEEVRAELRSQPKPILLDLAEVDRMTSAGVGLITTIYTAAQHARKHVALANLNTTVKRILEVVQVPRFLACFENEAQALSALADSGWSRY